MDLHLEFKYCHYGEIVGLADRTVSALSPFGDSFLFGKNYTTELPNATIYFFTTTNRIYAKIISEKKQKPAQTFFCTGKTYNAVLP